MGEFPSQRPGTCSFDVFFDLRLNKRLCKQHRRRWFETPSRSLWRHCNDTKLLVAQKRCSTVSNFEVIRAGESIMTQIERFRTLTPVLIHRWLRNNAQCLEWHKRGALLFSDVNHQISSLHGRKIDDLNPNWAFPDYNSSLNSQMATEWYTKLEVAKKGALLFFKVICQIWLQVTGAEKSMAWLGFEHFRMTRLVAAIKSIGFALFLSRGVHFRQRMPYPG